MNGSESSPSPLTEAIPPRAVTARALAIGLAGAALFCAITPYNDYKIGASYLAGNQFPVGAFFFLFLLAAPVNAVLRRIAPQKTFARGEILTVWILMLVASGLSSSGLMRFLLPHIAAPSYFSNSANNFEARIWGGLPAWLTVSDRAAGAAYFSGYPRGAEHVPWGAWVRPLLGWGVFAACFYVVSFCLANLLRRQWIENEKFVFPLVSLPLLLVEEPTPGTFIAPALRSPLIWCAVLLCTGLHTTNGLHQLYPTVPSITTFVDFRPYLTSPPWDQIGQLTLQFFPLVMGIAFLLPSDVGFSLWFFFLFFKAEILIGAMYNWDMPASLGSPSEKQFHSLEGFGGAMGLVGWTLWTARRHLRDVWEKAANGPRAVEIDDTREMFSYRATVIGLAIGYSGMALWLRLATVPWHLVGLSLLLITLSLVTVSWMITQAGTLYTVMPCMSIDALGATMGTHQAGPGAWYVAQRVECIFYRDTREMLMPEILTGTKIAETGGFAPRFLFPAMMASILLGLVVALIASLQLPYYNGGANLLQGAWTFRVGPIRPLNMAANLSSSPIPGNAASYLHIAAGFVGTLALLLLRARFGFGLHPIGFVSASVDCARVLWFSLLLGWICKTLILRFGGMKGYRATLPFFMGLILGDILNTVVWTILGALTGIGYNMLPQ